MGRRGEEAVTTSHAEYARTALERDDEDGPPPGYRLLRERKLTARVAHDCDFCGEPSGIQPGDRYVERVELDYGRLSIGRYCVGGCCSRYAEPAPPRRPEPPLGPDELPF